ncbi:MAG: hypothetical protein WBZ37_19845, partial [Mycobacterium sp.]
RTPVPLLAPRRPQRESKNNRKSSEPIFKANRKGRQSRSTTGSPTLPNGISPRAFFKEEIKKILQ